MTKIINWKIKIPLTNYSLRHFTLIDGDFQNSTIEDRVKHLKADALCPMV